MTDEASHDTFEDFLQATGDAADRLLDAKDIALGFGNELAAAELSALVARIHALQNATVPRLPRLTCPRSPTAVWTSFSIGWSATPASQFATADPRKWGRRHRPASRGVSRLSHRVQCQTDTQVSAVWSMTASAGQHRQKHRDWRTWVCSSRPSKACPPRATGLVVESFSRLNRLHIDEALDVFFDIVCKGGVALVTLQDRRAYTKQSVRNDKGQIYQISSSAMHAARDHADNISYYSTKSWRSRRGSITNNRPAWIIRRDGVLVLDEAKVRHRPARLQDGLDDGRGRDCPHAECRKRAAAEHAQART